MEEARLGAENREGWIELAEESSDLVSAVEEGNGGRRSGSRRRQFPRRHG
jgi:hypothetical protein